MSEQDKKAGEPPVEKAQGVENTEQQAPLSDTEFNYELELQKKEEALAHLAKERDNYKRGLLKAKGKIDEETPTEEDAEERMRRIVREEMLNSEQLRLQQEKDNLIKKALRENAELKTALKNRSQIPNSSQGSSTEPIVETKVKKLSDQQISELKARGWNDEKIKKFETNLARNAAKQV